MLQLLLARKGVAAEGFCGEALVARLPVTAPVKELTIRAPKGEGAAGELGELSDEGIGVVWTWPTPTARGVYQIDHKDAPIFALAVNLPAEESNLETLPPDVLQNRLAAGRAVYYRSASSDNEQRDDRWAWILAGCVLCLLGEIAALIGFRT
jgi:hypothetical protein